MPSIQQALATLLAEVSRPGDFYATGTIDMHPPRLEVEGVGPIALPLLPVQADQIIAAAERAPYGRGTETLVDIDVRRTWQVGAERVRITGSAWGQDLAGMVAQAAAGLGVSGPVEAELYKLLVYDAGSFFLRHRDSEKAPGMFATLVVVLPSDYDGGELVIRHKGHEVRLDLRRDEPSAAAFAAFYADCVHELLPVASGYRLALIYNLLRTAGEPLPTPPDYDREQDRAAALLLDWAREAESPIVSDPERAPTKLIYPLEHAYTQAELGFSALKGADAAVAGVMLEAARRADCDLHLALVSIAESGWAEYAGGGGYRGRYWDDSDAEFEVGEVDERSETVHDWRGPDGSHPPLGALPFEPYELSPPDAFADLEPDELDFQEATGNEGASFERLYQRAAVVVWPRSQRVAVLAEGGLEATVPFLGELVRAWRAKGDAPGAPTWQEGHRLAVRIRHDWPESAWERSRASKDGHTSALLGHLIALGDLEEIDAFLAERTANGAYDENDNPAVADALMHLAEARAGELLTAIIAHNAPTEFAACANLLARFCSLRPTAPLRPAALALLEALRSEAPQVPAASADYGGTAPTDTLVVDLLTAFDRIDSALAGEAVEHMLAHPRSYPIDGVLVFAALRLAESPNARMRPAMQALRAAVIAHLQRRLAEPLEPPADWRRASEIACSCTYCRDLSRFLADPDRSTWLLKAAQAARSHVENSIHRSRCDLDCVTDQRGRPYTLRCTKNQASHQRRVAQRRQDVAHLARLENRVTDGVPG